MKGSLIIFLLFSFILLKAQTDNDFPSIDKNDISDAQFARTEYFDGDGLWGHIDGGADVYLEYGFDKLLFQEILWKGISFRAEYYRMKDAEAAYGIYSVSRFKCSKSDTLSNYVCITAYQVQSALGRFYISVVNDKGTKEAEHATIKLFEKILSKSNEKEFQFPSAFRKNIFKESVAGLKVIKGPLGFQNGYSSWLDYFDQFKNYSVYILPIEKDSESTSLSLIKFGQSDDVKKFSNVIESMKNSNASVLRKIKIISADQIIFIESNRSKEKLEEIIKDLE